MCEFITAGGFAGQDLPENLLQEALLMRDALLRDLADLDVELQTTHDARLQPSIHANSRQVLTQHEAWQAWAALARSCDAAWLIAPETSGILHKLTQTVSLEGAWVLGCGAGSVELCSSKMATYLHLSAAGIACVPTFDVAHWPRLPDTSYLAKPNDGAGCEATVCFDQTDGLVRWLRENQAEKTHIIQPYLAGISASLSCILHAGRALLLSANQQYVVRAGEHVQFKGVAVNALAQHWAQANELAAQVAAAMPALSGYLGIDAILQDGKFVVLEINPRLTTSYVGLRESLGKNPAELVLNMLQTHDFQPGNLTRKRVDIHV